jgi:hypothetical protein
MVTNVNRTAIRLCKTTHYCLKYHKPIFGYESPIARILRSVELKENDNLTAVGSSKVREFIFSASLASAQADLNAPA